MGKAMGKAVGIVVTIVITIAIASCPSLRDLMVNLGNSKKKTIFSLQVVWGLIFQGFSIFKHRQQDRNNILDRFGYRPSPFNFIS